MLTESASPLQEWNGQSSSVKMLNGHSTPCKLLNGQSKNGHSTNEQSTNGRSTHLQTTVIGSFPKPDYLQLPDWFRTGSDAKSSLATVAYTQLLKEQTEQEQEELEADIMRATKEVVETQKSHGIDVITDGEVRRENYIHYHCRFMNGVDFESLTEKACRNGAYRAMLPTVRGRVSWRGPLNVAAEWRKSQDVAGSTPMKYTLPGPMTIIGTIHNEFYNTEEELAADLATIVNGHVRALVAAGCRHIQIDEPLFARKPQEALQWGIKMLDRCFEGIDGATCERTVHVCCGYPGHLDDENYLKADPTAYFKLAPALDASCVDAVSIEDAHCHNDLTLLERFKRKKVIFGVIQNASSRVESAEEIEERLRKALQHIDANRLVVAPDCGLAYLPPHIIQKKMMNMCIAAKRCCDVPACARARSTK